MDTKRIIPKSLLKPLALSMGALTLACFLQSCGSGESQPPDPNTTTADTSLVTEIPEQDTTNASPTDPTDPTTALRTYYEKLIAELRQELLDEREDRYISDHKYQNRLEALEETIAALENALDTPTGGEPETSAPDTPLDTEAETETPTPSMFTYRVTNGQACITAYTGTDETVNVPPEIDGYTVVAIGDQAFQNTPVRSVILPATVREVGWFAFGGCFGLELVSIPTSVEKINYGAFDGCPYVVILCAADSYASAYAVSFGLPHQYV